MSDPVLTKITRNLLAQYYGITESSTTTYSRINTGFIKLSEENSPQVDNTAYIADKNSSPVVTGYENKWSFEAQYVKGDPVVDDIVEIAREQKTGSDCERLLVDVDMNDRVGETGTVYNARQFKVAVEATPPAGEPRQITSIGGAFHQVGDLVMGTFDTSAKTFTTGDA